MGNQPSKNGSRSLADSQPDARPQPSRADSSRSRRFLKGRSNSSASVSASLQDDPDPDPAPLAPVPLPNAAETGPAPAPEQPAVGPTKAVNGPAPASPPASAGTATSPAPHTPGPDTPSENKPPAKSAAAAQRNTTAAVPQKLASILTRSEPGPISNVKSSSSQVRAAPAITPPDLERYITTLLDAASGKITKAVCLSNSEIISICRAARTVFLSQPTLLELAAPVKIAGDIHGQYADLIRLFEMCGFPPDSNYLFLGDYVDRGKQSLETILLLFCYKIKYPENFFLLRGNHECANVTRVYGFYDECKRRCNVKIWKEFVDVFNTLPIAATVASKIFCVHGGLSPELHSMDLIRKIARPTDVPDGGLLNDLLWSDPDATGSDKDWTENERGVSYCFGKSVIENFLHKHEFDLVCRAHMVVEDGYEFYTDRLLVTVFSAPNYCGEFDNWGAVMAVDENLLCSFQLLQPKLNLPKKYSKKKGGLAKSPPASQFPQSV